MLVVERRRERESVISCATHSHLYSRTLQLQAHPLYRCTVQTVYNNVNIVRELSDDTLMKTIEFGLKRRDPYAFELAQRAVQVPICAHRASAVTAP